MATLQEKSCSKKITASVVIPSYKRLNLAFKLAQKIKRIDKEIEVIIVDQENNSSIKQSLYKINKIKYINIPQANLPKARNIGIKNALGEIVIFFDDDVDITSSTIRNHINAYSNPDIVGVAGRVINDGEKISKLSDVPAGKTNFLGLKFTSNFWSTKKQFVDFPYGCNMSFRKETLNRTDGFDNDFPKIFEEIDIARRVKKFGRILFEPKALAYHHKARQGGIRDQEKQNKQKLIFENYGHYLAKNIIFPFSLLSLLLRSRSAARDSLGSVMSLLKGYLKYILVSANFWSFFIFFTALILRFCNVPENFVFDIDTEYQSLLAKTIIKDFHIIWIGVSASNIGYYLGPGLVYLTAILLKISGNDPVILGYFASFVGSITLLSVYYVASKLFNQKTAVLSSVIYGFSFFITYYDRKFWPIFVPLISVWMFYSLIKAQKNLRWLILSTALMAVSYHVHLSLLIFWPFIVWNFVKHAKKINLSNWIFSILSFLIITSPLLIFDIVHNFDNLLMPVRFLKNIQQAPPKELNFNFIYLLSLVKKVFFNNQQNYLFVTLFLSLLLTFVLISLLNGKKNEASSLLVGVITMLSLMFGLYPGPMQEYYIVIFFPFIALTTGLILSRFSTYIGFLVALIFMVINLYSFSNYINFSGLENKKIFIKEVSRNITDSYYLSYKTDRDYEGWRYLFETYGKTPNQSKADNMFGWLYQNEISAEKPKLEVSIIEQSKNNCQQSSKRIDSGIFTACITELP